MNRSALLRSGSRIALGFAAAAVLAWQPLAAEAGSLTYAAISEPVGLSLHEEASGATFVSLQAMYEPLLRLAGDMSLRPGLAREWRQLDDVTYEIVLQPDVRFHSGNALTAADVKDTFAWHLDPASPGYAYDLLEPIGEMEVVDDLTLRIVLKRPYGPFLHQLTTPQTAISDMAKYREVGADGLRATPSGTGPFVLDTWSRGAELVLAVNPDYWGGAPVVEELRFRFIPDASARSIALETGEVDIVESVAAPDLPRLMASPDIVLPDAFELRTILWLINTRDPLLGDVDLRRAVAHSIDVPAITAAILADAGRALGGFVPEEAFGFAPFAYDYDPDRAAELLEKAGWSRGGDGFYAKDGIRFTFAHVSGQHMAQELQVAEAVQAMLHENGIEMEIVVLERVTHTSTMFEYARAVGGPVPDFGTTQWDHGIRTGDASVALDPIFTCGGPRNFGGFCDADYDVLIEAAVSGAPEDERRAAFAEAQQILYDNVAAIPLWQPRITLAARSRVTDLDITPTRVIYFDEIGVTD